MFRQPAEQKRQGLEFAMPRLVLEDGTIVGRLSRSDAQRFVLGSGESSDIRLDNDPHISDVHACITWIARLGVHLLHDCGSAHGTFIDDVPVLRPLPLSHGACIRLGLTDLIYCSQVVEPGIIRWSRFNLCMELIPVD